jgi:predicted RNA-binding protein with PUA-like domain
MRVAPELANMRLLARGNRLSIMPIAAKEWHFITTNLMGQQ